MAENWIRGRNRVRDMYEGVNLGEMTEHQRKEHRDKILHENPDVLFRIFHQGKLHVLLFMPSNEEEWKKMIQSRIPPTVSFQLTERCAVRGRLPIIHMSGHEEALECICDSFDQLYNEVMENIQHGGATQRNIAAELEEVKMRIRELELEIDVLRRRLVCV